MSFSAPQTPHRPGLPGAYVQTPAQSANQWSGQVVQSSLQTRAPSSNQQLSSDGQNNTISQTGQQGGQVAGAQTTTELRPIQRASRTINDTLAREAQFPELDTYVGRTYDPCLLHLNID